MADQPGTFSMAAMGAPNTAPAAPTAAPATPAASSTPGTFSLTAMTQPDTNTPLPAAAGAPPAKPAVPGSISGRSGAPNVMASNETDADVAKRQSPIATGVGTGLEELSSPLLHPIDSAIAAVKSSIPGTQMVNSFKQAIPMFRAFHDALSQGKSLHEAIVSANDYATRQEKSSSNLAQAIADYEKTPSTQTADNLKQAAAHVGTLALGTAAQIAAGGVGATAEAAPEDVLQARMAALRGEAPAQPTQPGIIQQVRQGAKVAQPGAQAAVKEGVAASEEAIPHKGVTPSVHPVETDPTIRDAARLDPFPPDQIKIKTMPPVVGESGEGAGRSAGLPTVRITGPRGSAIELEADGKTLRVKGIINSGEPGDGQRMYDNAIQYAKDSGYETFEGDKVQTPAGQTAWQRIAERHAARKSDTGVSSIDLKPSQLPPEPVPAPAGGRLVEGHNVVTDPQLQNIQNQAKAAYKAMDEVAGFDVKALKDKLATDQYNLKQLGSADPDKAGRIIEGINDAQSRITEAEGKMRAAGIDPDVPDNLHKALKAGQDFRKVLVNRTDPATGDVNIKGLLQDAQKLRNNPKYGDRLAQFMGSKDAADTFMQKLAKADAQGIKAASARQLATWAGRIVGGAALGSTAWAGVTHFFNHATGAAEPVQ